MQTQAHNTGKAAEIQARRKRGRREVRRNTCADCVTVKTRNLTRYKRAEGDLFLCDLHARLRGLS